MGAWTEASLQPGPSVQDPLTLCELEPEARGGGLPCTQGREPELELRICSKPWPDSASPGACSPPARDQRLESLLVPEFHSGTGGQGLL